jgi:AcrR family transcriptional regulator
VERQVSSPEGVAKRSYRMRKRGESIDRTRRRIRDAAVRLHTSVGPSAASMSAIAEEAGVTRLTLYRHFPSKGELFQACMTHWRSLHPPPDPDRWRSVTQFDARLRTALTELYGWYEANGDDLYPIYRDASHTPASNRLARRQTNERNANAILSGLELTPTGRRRLRAAVGHVVGFWTWHSLAVDQGLSTREAASVAANFVVAARRSAVD